MPLLTLRILLSVLLSLFFLYSSFVSALPHSLIPVFYLLRFPSTHHHHYPSDSFSTLYPFPPSSSFHISHIISSYLSFIPTAIWYRMDRKPRDTPQQIDHSSKFFIIDVYFYVSPLPFYIAPFPFL